MSVEIKRNYGKLNINSIPEQYLDLTRSLMINGFTDVEIKVIIDDMTRRNNYIRFESSDYGKVVREAVDPDAESIIRHLTPFGVDHGKIILPEAYMNIKKENSDEVDEELIYNLCMTYNNFYFFLLLSFDQKRKLYKLLIENPKRRLFGYRDSEATFDTLFDELDKRAFHIDATQSVDVIRRMLKIKKDDHITPELQQMINQNIEKDIEYYKFKWGIKEIILGDKIIESNLKEYLQLIYYFNKDKIVFKKLNSADYLVNGTPQIRTIRYPESPIN